MAIFFFFFFFFFFLALHYVGVNVWSAETIISVFSETKPLNRAKRTGILFLYSRS